VGALLVGVESGMDRGVEVVRVERSDEFVALELRPDGILQLGEDDRDALGVEIVVEGEQHVGCRRVDVGDRLGGDDDPAGWRIRRREMAQVLTDVRALAKSNGASNRKITGPEVRDDELTQGDRRQAGALSQSCSELRIESAKLALAEVCIQPG
jgi:hypothetical protein